MNGQTGNPFRTEVTNEADTALGEADSMLRARALVLLTELAQCAASIIPGSAGWRGLFGASSRKVRLKLGRGEAQYEVVRKDRVVRLAAVRGGRPSRYARELPLWRAVAAQWSLAA